MRSPVHFSGQRKDQTVSWAFSGVFGAQDEFELKDEVETPAAPKSSADEAQQNRPQKRDKKKLSYKEKQEWDGLEAAMEKLETQQSRINGFDQFWEHGL